MSDVIVKFGAQLDELIDGVKGAKSAIESVGESTDKITEGFKTLAEVAGVSISIAGFKSFVESMASLGSQTETSMARLGQSAEQITTLQGVAAVADVSFQALQASIEKASLNIQKSTKDGYNPAAQALRVLGLTAKELVGLPADQWFAKISDAVSKFNPSLNLTNAVTAAFGRNAAQMLPLLLQGSEHFNEMAAAVRKAQDGLAAAIPGMSDTHDKLAILGLSVQSLGARIFSVLKPAIDGATKWFTDWVQSLDTKTIASAVTQIVAYSTDAMLSIGNLAISLLETFASVSGGLDPLIKKLEVLALGASIGTALAGLKGAIAGAGIAAAVAMFADQYQKIPEVTSKANVKLDAERAKLASIVAAIKAQFSNLNLTPPSVAATGGNKQDAGAIDAGAKNELASQATKIEEQIAAEQAKLARIKTIFQEEADASRITQQQKALYTETAIEQAYQAELALIAKKEALYSGDMAQYAKVEQEKAKLTDQYNKEMLATVQTSQKEMTTSVTSSLTTITGLFNSQLRGLLAGTTSWATATKNIAADLTIKLIELGEEWVVKRIASMVSDALLQKTTAAAGVAATATAEAAKTEAVVAGAAARAGAETTGAAAGIGTQIAAAITSIGIDAGKVFAGVFGFLAPVMGPAAAGPAAAAEATTFAAGLAPLATGAWEIPSVMPALLHPGEMVVPANYASGLRSQASGGGSGGQGGSGPGISLNFSNFIGNQAFINQIMPQLAKAFSSYQARTPSMA